MQRFNDDFVFFPINLRNYLWCRKTCLTLRAKESTAHRWWRCKVQNPTKRWEPLKALQYKESSVIILTLSFYLGLHRFLFYLYQLKYQSFTAFGEYAELFPFRQVYNEIVILFFKAYVYNSHWYTKVMTIKNNWQLPKVLGVLSLNILWFKSYFEILSLTFIRTLWDV